MRCDPDHFDEEAELALLYVARKLKESLALEKVLDDAGLDYLVETDTYSGGVVFRTERVGAFFYVAPADEGRAQVALKSGGYKPYSTKP